MRHRLLTPVALLSTILLSACGQSDPEPATAPEAATVQPSTSAPVAATPTPVAQSPAPEPAPTPASPAPAPTNVQGTPKVAAPVVTRFSLPQATATSVGAWGPVIPWPVIPIHASVLPDGRLVTYGTTQTGTQTAMFDYDVWDSFAGTGADSHLTLPNETATDVFCGSNLVMPLTGNLLVNGGDNYSSSLGRSTNTPNSDATLFDATTNRFERAGTMQRPRWYGSAITLPNGETYIQGGSGGNDRAEIRSTAGQHRLLTGFSTNDLASTYPRIFTGPDGKVFGLGYTKMFRIDPAANNGTGSRTDLGTTTGFSPASDTPVVMFQPGKILLAGGNDTKAAIVDINGTTPVVRAAGTISQVRKWSNATVLADGRVALTGGSSTANAAVNLAYHIELFTPDEQHPQGGTWTTGPSAQRMRLYHSVSLLLPDATLYTGGGGAPSPQTNLNAEIYYPPYLFGTDGNLAARPSITQAPKVLKPGAQFEITSPQASAIRRVTLVQTGNTTHSLDRSQRFIELKQFTRSGNTLRMSLPSNVYETPPGHYMLFVIDAAGVPSVAPVMRIEPVATP